MVKKQVKKLLILLLATATVIGISAINPSGDAALGNVAYAANEMGRMDDIDRDTGSFKAQFSYDMAKITERLMAVPNTNIDTFKAEYSYAIARVNAKMLPLIPSEQRNSFAYELTQLTTRVVSAQNLDVENTKVEFSYTVAQITSKVLGSMDKVVIGRAENAYAGGTSLIDDRPRQSASPATAGTGYIDNKTYASLVDDLKKVGTRGKNVDHKVNVDGEIRYHYAFNRGYQPWEGDSSALRFRLAFDTDLDKDWRLYGMVEATKSLGNYYNKFGFERLYAAGKIGTTLFKVGKFDYLMAEGNIYDSYFSGVRADFGDVVKYSVSLGKTYASENTSVVTATYKDYDYSLDAGLYHYQQGGVNTIYTLNYRYNFSDFSVGAMYLGASRKDSAGNNNGYVLSLNIGDLKTWRKGTFDVFAKYYDQPRYTYIAHGMNGLASTGVMEGFKGFGYGVHYTFRENLVGGLEFYDLADKVYPGRKARTLWSDITYYF